MTDEDRIGYLGGDDSVPLEPGERAELDQLRQLLGSSALWAEPPADMEDRVAVAIAAERDVSAAPASSLLTTRARHRWRGTLLGVAAAIVLTLAVGIGVSLFGHDQSGEHFSLALAAPSGAGGAEGHVDYTRTTSGWRIELVADALPRLDNGRFYEAWMRNAAGTLVPIGTFNEAHHIVLWSGVSPRDFTTLTVTEEEADGNQASSGHRVLTGTLTIGD